LFERCKTKVDDKIPTSVTAEFSIMASDLTARIHRTPALPTSAATLSWVGTVTRLVVLEECRREPLVCIGETSLGSKLIASA
jgi:hypothetical protein